MAEKIPHNFQETGEAAIQSFDFEDIISGKAVETFYGIDCNDLDQEYALVSIAVRSQTIKSYGETSTGLYTKEADADFDSKFNIPRVIEGEAQFEVTVGMTKKTIATNAQCYPHIRVRKVPAVGAEQELADISGAALINASLNAADSKLWTFNLDIPKTHFAIGDTLRITVEAWGLDFGDIAYVGFAHDPTDRNDDLNVPKIIEDADTTVFKALIPFNPDL